MGDTGSYAPPQAPQTQTDQIVAVALDEFTFFLSDGKVWAYGETHKALANWPLRSPDFGGLLRRLYYRRYRKTPNPNSLSAALSELEGRALVEAEEWPLYYRVAFHHGQLCLDLADDRWQHVAVDESGWDVYQGGVNFRRTNGMHPLPLPQRGGDISLLRQFLNVASEDDFRLLVAWLLQALNARGPFPILVLNGEQGIAKSTTARVLRSLIDPHRVLLRSAPKDERDLVIAAQHNWVLVFDNLSFVPQWLSDALCRLSTGGGFATRQLYTDGDEVVFEAQRPIIINGIDELATRSDLLDRVILVTLPRITPDRRLTERQFWRDFETARPMILGALLDAVCHAMANPPAEDCQRRSE